MEALLYYIKLCLTSRYFNFHGRASRREYWGFTIFAAIVAGVASVLFDELKETYYAEDGGFLYLLLILIVGFAVLYMVIPSLSVTVRRLHDIGKSGWWLLIGIIPTIGEIILFIMCLMPSQPFDNRYGRIRPY